MLYDFVFVLPIVLSVVLFTIIFIKKKSVNPKIPSTNIITANFLKKRGSRVKRPYVIGIAGASGSGKSYISEAIVETIRKKYPDKKTVIISQDNYYVGGNADTNYDVPESIDFDLLCDHVAKLTAGNFIECPTYDFKNHKRDNHIITINPDLDVIILEGILILSQEKVRNLLDTKVYVQVDLATSIFRRIRRDIYERGRNLEEVHERYIEHVMPSYLHFVEPSASHADVRINNNKDQYCGTTILIDHIIHKLESVN